MGRVCEAGFYDYAGGKRSAAVAPITQQLAERYERNRIDLCDEDVMLMLSIPMWVEAALAFREGVVTSPADFDLAMRGGLGYQSRGSWLDFFDRVGSQRMLRFVEQHGPTSKSLQVPGELLRALAQHRPATALADPA